VSRSMARSAWALLPLCLLAACADDVANTATATDSTPARTASTTTSQQSSPGTIEAQPADTGPPADGPVVKYSQPAPSQTIAMAAEVAGVLTLDGDCLYIERDTKRYPMVWPYGTTWDAGSTTVMLPSGESIPLGAHLIGGGGYLHEVNLRDYVGDQAATIALDCADDATGEVAVVNNYDDAIGLATG